MNFMSATIQDYNRYWLIPLPKTELFNASFNTVSSLPHKV